MLNSAACHSKTPRSGAGAVYCEKSSKGKGLIQGRGVRYRRTSGTSRYMIESTRQHIPTRPHESHNWPCIAMPEARNARGLEFNRVPFDDQRLGYRGTAEPKEHLKPVFAVTDRQNTRCGCKPVAKS